MGETPSQGPRRPNPNYHYSWTMGTFHVANNKYPYNSSNYCDDVWVDLKDRIIIPKSIITKLFK
jgi:hypothetical protein